MSLPGTSAASTHHARLPVAQFLLFALTGVGLVLPGTLLPFLARSWGWQDGRAGWLFFLFFAGTTAGAFCARGALGRMLLVATMSVFGTSALLVHLQGLSISAAFLLNGFGLGVTMTAVTLLRSRLVPAHRALELTRLNLAWALGAASAPVLLLRCVPVLGLGATLQAYALAYLLCGAAAALPLWNQSAPGEGAWTAWRQVRTIPVFFSLCLPLATGIEAGVGAWLVTFALRGSQTYTATISAGTALWLGVLLSRLFLSSQRFRLASAGMGPSFYAGVLVCGLLLLLFETKASLLVAGAFCAGFGVGPVYPELLAALLNRSEAGNAGFLVAGVGSACLPYLIGQVSQQTHSLRTGLVIPFIGALLLFVVLLGKQKAVSTATG